MVYGLYRFSMFGRVACGLQPCRLNLDSLTLSGELFTCVMSSGDVNSIIFEYPERYNLLVNDRLSCEHFCRNLNEICSHS